MAESHTAGTGESGQRKASGTVWRLHIDHIQTIAGFNPRSHKNTNDVEDLMEFMRSTKNRRKLAPIHVVERGGQYFLTQGHRRLKAARKLCEDGVAVAWLNAVIDEDADEYILLAEAVAENQGVPLQPMEEARAYRKMVDKGGWTVAEISRKTGRTVQHIYNRLHLFDASPAVKKAVAEGKLSVGDATRVVKNARHQGKSQRDVLRVQQAAHVDRRKIRHHPQTAQNHIRGLVLPLVERYGFALVREVVVGIPAFLGDQEEGRVAKEEAGVVHVSL